ncbi:MAG: division/cell wall cluster transcriptional repressor MraZ [Clostridiales bacterium]|nr:division/cell wall cluster transcriptional repressor MraZ [Clostridiales bacterium]MBQ3107133.1 division/cell wall cluster transcriptional repressor MraZ [Bacillota bacterium]
MFMGEYQNSIDAKGRLIVPAKFREDLGFRFIMTKGLDHCLFLYSMDEWEKFEERLKELPVADKDARAFIRSFYAGATECEIDKQGRISIPTHLRDHAKIEKELVTIGAMNRVEIWSKAEWTSYCERTMDTDEIAEKMAQLGI